MKISCIGITMRNLPSLLLAPLLFGCPSSSLPSIVDSDTDLDAVIIEEGIYRFPGRTPTENSVSFTGQAFRQLLINDLSAHIGDLTDRLNNTFLPSGGDVRDELTFYYDFDSDTSGSLEPLYSAPFPLLQDSYDALSTGKDLNGKLAGNDAVTDHKDWSTAFTGWTDPDVTSPESLVRLWIDQIDAQAVDWAMGTYPLDPAGRPVEHVYLTDDGLDLRQLLEKLLRGAVTLSQGADDYLDDDIEGKGLLSDHTTVEEGEPFTALEHAWDEGYGYFGASVRYGEWTDQEIRDGSKDDDGDGRIDLRTEVSVGSSVNCAKRDQGAVVATDFTGDAFTAFHAGRTLLATTDGPLSPREMTELKGHRDQIITAWEGALAATCVHYINQVLVDMEEFGTSTYSYTDHAKHWSELKGFALGFQFNPRSALTDAPFADLHEQLGPRPVLPTADSADIESYKNDLLAARALLGTAYGFDAQNLGGDDGQNGW